MRKSRDRWGLDDLLSAYRGLVFRPQAGGGAVVEGSLQFKAKYRDPEIISDCYDVRIEIKPDFPHSLPRVWETGHRIPRDYHTNRDDNSLCLGSRLKLLITLAKCPTLVGYVKLCLIPYLYRHSYRKRYGRAPFGQLEHGDPGVLREYEVLFGVKGQEACLEMLRLLGLKKRVANKERCPCGSGRRVGECHHKTLKRLREAASPSLFKREYARVRSTGTWG